MKNYIVRINFNRSTNIRNIPLIPLTIILVVATVVSFTVGTIEALTGTVPLWLLIVASVLLVGVVLVSGLPVQVKRGLRDLNEWRQPKGYHLKRATSAYMSEADHESARASRARAIASLLGGGERVAKGRQRDGDD